MDLTPYVDNLRQELAVAADAGGDDARALAERLTAPLESAARLTLLNALSAAMSEVTRELAPGSVDVRLRGLEPEFVVTPPPAPEPFREPREAWEAAPAPASATPPPPFADDDGAMARINFRLPAHLKARAESTAAEEGLSVNAWLVRAVSTALDGGERANPPGRAKDSGGRGFTGWVR
ncbi:toxin-antitoxin system HicB family antitoxin [Streptomyces polygonati]|uniref:Toxin-antitoxin system HicB family antitoxin n=1 Tax=Streptomyces polygonati TaxID=1617087 RepID=A0ABV8HRZ9_9ACTN